MDLTKTRVEKWDNLKCLLIFLVVLGHITDLFVDISPAADKMSLFIYTFHMPLFIFVSGLFCKKNVDLKRYDKIASYLIMYVAIKFIVAITKLIITKTISVSLFSESGVSWYAFAIFAFSLITILIRNISPKYILIFSVIFACLYGYTSDSPDILVVSRIIVFYPFFYLGYISDGEKITEFLSKKSVRIISAVIIVIYLVIVIIFGDRLIWTTILSVGKYQYTRLPYWENFGGLLRLAWYAVVFLLGASIISLTPNRKIAKGFFSYIGKKSMQIYALHFVFIGILFSGIKIHQWLLPHHPIILIFLTTVVVMALCLPSFWTKLFEIILYPPKRKSLQNNEKEL